jgi:2-keto-4-pentenoate hydratase
MNASAAADAIWEGMRRGIHHPPELAGALSLDDGFRVQLALLERYRQVGERHAGWKVGLTAVAMQQQWGMHEPVFGFLLDSGHRESGAVFAIDELIRPGFENELCITMGAALAGPDVSLEQARGAIAEVAPALEIVERRGDFSGDLALAMADNAQQKAFVTARPVPLGPLDLAEVTLDLFVNGGHQEQARGAEVLGNPVTSIAWLANKLSRYGKRLEAGARVMSGSFTRQYAVARGDRVEARFHPLGTVSAAFR